MQMPDTVLAYMTSTQDPHRNAQQQAFTWDLA